MKNLYSHLKQKGYSHSKDDLGIYFDKFGVRFSIMKTGLWYTCYHNTKIDGNWQLYGKSRMFDKFSDALEWVVTESNKIL